LSRASITTDENRAQYDDGALVAAACRGDGAAFEGLYERYKTALFRTLLAMTHDRAVAEELLQDTFLRAYRRIGGVRLEPGACLGPWLHRIAVHLALDWCRKRKFWLSPLDSVIDTLVSPVGQPERAAERDDLQRTVLEALDRLPHRQRVVVILFYVNEFSIDEIAQTLEVAPGTVKSRLHYGRERLRRELEASDRVALPGLGLARA
jgi:RNA polymerase sigma-70 factor (ECF subfamily)